MTTTPIRRRRRGAAAALTATLAMVAGVPTGAVAAPTAPRQADDTTTLTVAVSQEVDSLSPFLAVRVITTSLHRLMYDFLTNYDPETGETIPALAESWDTSDDGLTWTYHIRDDATWIDGEPVTAADVEWTFTTMMTDEAAASANGTFVENFESVTATDERTVVVELARPQVTMLALDVPILPRHKWETIPDFSAFNNDEEFPVVGNGPFILTEYEPNQSITLESNPDYWRGAPAFDELVFRYFTDQDAMVEALRTSEVSFVFGLTPAQADALREESNITVNQAQGKRFTAFTVNPGARTRDGQPFGDGNPLLQDPVVRRALMHTLNREQLFDAVYGGYGEPNGALIPSRYDQYHWEPAAEEEIAYDVDEANRLLDEAGYTMGSDGVRVSPGGQRLSFRFNVHGDDPQRVATGQYMEEWAAEAGIELNVEPVSEVGSLLDAGTYDLLTTGWSVNPDPDFIMSINLCSGLPAAQGDPYLSDAYFCDPQYDELYQEQLAEFDPDRRVEIIHEMQQILYESGIFVVLGYPDQLEAYRSDEIASIQTQPDPGGNIYGQDGYWSWWSAVPAREAEESGGGAGMAIGITAAVVIVLGVGAFLLLRRRSVLAEERE